MAPAASHGAPSRKRRRQAVVCTECRRRKIACDRSAPCTQCLHSNLPCTYYSSYLNSGGSNDSSVEFYNLSTSIPPVPTMISAVADLGVEHLPMASTLGGAAIADHNHGWFNATGLSSITPLPLSISNHNINTNSNNDPLSFADPSTPAWPRIEAAVLTAADHSSTARAEIVNDRSASNISQDPKNLLGRHKLWPYPPNHWITICQKYGRQGCFDDIISVVFRNGEGHPLLQKCKRLARDLKTRTHDLCLRRITQPLQEVIPPRAVADPLIQAYLRTFDSVLRIFHVPTFQHEYEQYWVSPESANEILIVQILLAMSIGSCFCSNYPRSLSSSSSSPADNAEDEPTLHEQSTQWILAAHMRLSLPASKAHLTFPGVQSQCLLVIALLTNTSAVGGDLFWLTTATLVQSAFAIGLHSAPSKLSVSPFEAEMRRRLWITVIELAVQAGLDCGIHPMVTTELLASCEMPSNLNDSQIRVPMKTLPASQSACTFTQSSIPGALMRSLPVRLVICEKLSQFRSSNLSYEEARQTGAELTSILRETSDLIDSFATAPSAFEIQLQDLLARRFLLMLHSQFAHKAVTDDKYYFSRKVCLETSLLILSPLRGGWVSTSYSDQTTGGEPSHNVQSSNEYASLQSYGDGLFKHSFLGASITVCAEFLLQLCEDSSPIASSLSRRDLQQAIEDATALTQRRILKGETSVQAHAFLACVLAKTGRYKRRRPPQETKEQADKGIADAAKRSLEICCGILEARIGRMAALMSNRGAPGSKNNNSSHVNSNNDGSSNNNNHNNRNSNNLATFSWSRGIGIPSDERYVGENDHRSNGKESWANSGSGSGDDGSSQLLNSNSDIWSSQLDLWPN